MMIAVFFTPFAESTAYVLGIYSDEDKARKAVKKTFKDLYGEDGKAEKKTTELFNYMFCEAFNTGFSVEEVVLDETENTLKEILG